MCFYAELHDMFTDDWSPNGDTSHRETDDSQLIYTRYLFRACFMLLTYVSSAYYPIPQANFTGNETIMQSW